MKPPYGDYVVRGNHSFDPYLLKALARAAMEMQEEQEKEDARHEEAGND